MKTKLLSIILVIMLALSVIACGGSAPAASSTSGSSQAAPAAAPKADEPAQAEATEINWEKFEGWSEENWDGKDIAYQFTGEWELAEYNYYYSFLINLYTDGSAMVDQRNTGTASSYYQYGYWSEENTPDGNEIAFDTLYATHVNGALIDHEYSYSLYEESDGNYSFGYTFGISPGAYFREAPVAGGKDVAYATTEAFHEAVDNIYETHRFVSTEADENGLTLRISTFSDNTAVINLIHPEHDVINHKDGALKAVYDAAGAATYSLVINDEAEIPLTQNADGTFAEFEVTYDADLMGNAIHLVATCVETEVPAE